MVIVKQREQVIEDKSSGTEPERAEGRGDG